MELKVKIRKDGKFYFVESNNYPVFTQGRTKQEAIDNFKEAFILYAEDMDSQARFPELSNLFPASRTMTLQIQVILPKLFTYGSPSNLIGTRASPDFV
ncbi:hypothetical protein HY989_04600 [Candidatus Micrarchaeota archaeon]|nr:hypothetical protein [Candidatus Micrarchaeota archaeon]